MSKDFPSVNPKLDAMGEMLKTIHDLQKENAELKAQIEKMKCCENCKYSDTECEEHIICCKGHFFECLSNKIFDHTTKEKDYWEIKEND